MSNTSPKATEIKTSNSLFHKLLPLILLLIVGSLLEGNVVLSHQVAKQNLPTFWFVAVTMFFGGVILLIIAGITRQIYGDIKVLLTYGAIAGALMVIGTIIPYSTVTHVGVSYISILYTTSILITYLIALSIGLDKFRLLKVLAVSLGLGGGLYFAFSKSQGMNSTGIGWIALASTMPVFLALGNIYRTRYWPKNASAILLAALLLMFAGGELALFSLFFQQGSISQLVGNTAAIQLLCFGVLFNGIYFIFFFLLQKVAGPVYLSQIGSVAAILGAIIGFYFLGETLSTGFFISAILIAVGVILFQLDHIKPKQTSSPLPKQNKPTI